MSAVKTWDVLTIGISDIFNLKFNVVFLIDSGAHINPCVTLAFLFIGQQKILMSLLYIWMQTLGATLGGLLARVSSQ